MLSAVSADTVLKADAVEGRPLRADAERNRAKILEAAADVFASAGVEATLHDVAARAGVGVGTVYRRFPHKEALLGALFDDKLREIIDLVQKASAEPDSWAALVGFFRSFTEMQSQNRGLYEVLNGSEYCQDRVAEARDVFLPPIQRVLGRAQADGYVRSDLETSDLSVILLMLNAVGMISQDVSPHLWERYLDLVLEGIRARPDQPPLARPALTDDEMEQTTKGWQRLRR
jgi:AcrR family transcriptional regulator